MNLKFSFVDLKTLSTLRSLVSLPSIATFSHWLTARNDVSADDQIVIAIVDAFLSRCMIIHIIPLSILISIARKQHFHVWLTVLVVVAEVVWLATIPIEKGLLLAVSVLPNA